MRDITLDSTIYHKFTTRAFATGSPATLAGSPVLSIYEENNLTQITAGVSLTVDYDAVTGLNQAAIVATTANGYESGKSYDLVITTGTVGGVSVVGEVVFSFTIASSAAAVDLANATDGLTALKAYVASPTNITAATGIVLSAVTHTGAVIPTVTTLTGHTAQTGDSFALIGTAGAGLTNINLPNQIMDITGNITGNLSGSVGSVTGNVGGIAGTITTLDGLDTAQDTQHSTTQSAISTAQADINTLKAGIITGSAQTGTLSTSTMTTDLTGYTADQLVGRAVTFTSGAADGESTIITAYAVTGGQVSFTGNFVLTVAPGNTDTFKIT